jgi:hypothetical protein
VGYQPAIKVLEAKNIKARTLTVTLLEATEALDEVVVTATRTERSSDDVPLPVQLITEAQIDRIGALRLDEVLQEQTGLQMISDHGAGLQMQGLSSDYILILIDGEPVIGRTAGTTDLSRLTVNNIERIEIMIMKSIPFPLALYFGLLSSLLLLSGCSENDTDETGGTATLEVQIAEDIPADVNAVSGPPGQGPPPNYTFYSLTDRKVVDKADSSSTRWDIALAGTTILVNGGTSGPGQGEAQVVNGAFDALIEAPESGYQTDGEAARAIPTGSGNGWYNYTGFEGSPPNAVLPLPGRIIVLRTAEGNYAKMEILSYYQGNPDTSTPTFADPDTRPAGKYYTLRYVVQPNGSRQF